MLLPVGELGAMSVMVCAVRMNRGLGRRQRMVVAALVAGLLLAGCSGGDEPIEEPLDPGSSPGAIYTGEPLPKPTPVLPTEAREHTLEGADAAMRYFYELYNLAFASGDAGPLLKVSTSDCGPCKSVADAVARNRKAGREVEGGQVTVETSVPAWSVRDKEAVVSAGLSQPPSALRDVDGNVVGTAQAHKLTAITTLRWGSDGWRVADSKMAAKS